MPLPANRPLLLALPLLAFAPSGLAADCNTIADDQLRLECYDALFGRPLVLEESPVEAAEAEELVAALESEQESEVKKHLQREDLLFGHKFAILPHDKTYILPYTYMKSPNQRSYRGLALGPDQDEPLDNEEVKFQISLKIPLVEDFLLQDSTLWFGYTQLSLWQMYNTDASAPFRETNYSPEVAWSIPTGLSVLGADVELFNLGFVHQSNGRGEPLSRSWNRIYAEFVLARNRWAFSLKPWYRIPEDADDDDNPDIEDYLGYADLKAAYKWNDDWMLSATFRNNMQSEENRNSVTLGLSFPLPGRLNGYLEYVNGYGETLIDYNHRTQRIGIGVILTDWY
ncbi:phospholipase A [Pseudomaricurvus sp. HS19]|uniref:phospholipase A n=1 Tax=Pseudomaricurvus sp. HS19 TaxID=2692626 RepID=UPI00136C0DA1|nr:phospholipase A [Pseudomaricurvus sp. HS19]MYM63646.1 phospholipase [Pseudomaricurvus sp. HS19]